MHNNINTEQNLPEDIRSFEELGSSQTFFIPVWKRYVLTIVEAAAYYHIGEKKLRAIVEDHPNADFVVMNGNRVLIKKHRFEQFLDEITAV